MYIISDIVLLLGSSLILVVPATFMIDLMCPHRTIILLIIVCLMALYGSQCVVLPPEYILRVLCLLLSIVGCTRVHIGTWTELLVLVTNLLSPYKDQLSWVLGLLMFSPLNTDMSLPNMSFSIVMVKKLLLANSSLELTIL